jgi:phage host-nuclease inhibitor protein Gam
MSKRAKQVGVSLLHTREQAAAVASEVAGQQLERDRLAGDMEAELQDIRKHYTPQLDMLDQGIELRVQALRAWADENPAEFGDKRSIAFATAEVGYLVHPPHVTPTPQQRKDQGLIAAIVRLGGSIAQRCLAVKTALNRDAILDIFRLTEDIEKKKRTDLSEEEKEAVGMARELRKLDVATAQHEQFYVKPIREQLEAETLKAEAVTS